MYQCIVHWRPSRSIQQFLTSTSWFLGLQFRGNQIYQDFVFDKGWPCKKVKASRYESWHSFDLSHLRKLSNSGVMSQKSDVYAFGVVLLELLTGLEPIDTSRNPHSLVDLLFPILTKDYPDVDQLMVRPRYYSNPQVASLKKIYYKNTFGK